ncbi:MAG: Crp/Fnr family transcriptional regulator [Hyphomicrobiaceae bacterium]
MMTARKISSAPQQGDRTEKPRTEVPLELLDGGTTITLRPRQRLSISGSEDILYIVTDGVLLLDCMPGSDSRQIVDLFYRGDMIRPDFAPGLPGLGLLAAGRAEVCRLGRRKLDALLAANAELATWCLRRTADQVRRRLAHIAAIGVLKGEERLATVLVELALRMGEPGYENARTFDMALSRTDLADYLSLNADTLSRIMSRLRQSGVLGTAGRGRAYTPSFPALCALSPIADTVKALHGGSVGP